MGRGPSNSDNIVDVRDVIARVEELESQAVEADEETETEAEDGLDDDEREELTHLHALLDEMKGYGGDEQWRGDWYPLTLVADDYFETYARELAEDLGAITRDATWPNNHIDWEGAAKDLQQDYSSVDYNGATYWYR